MKKLFTTLLIIATVSSYAQITLENTYPTGSITKDYIRLVKLSSSGYKYAENSDSVLTLYNLDHSVFKSMVFPPFPGGVQSVSGGAVSTLYISEELFNTNPEDVEYLLFYTDLLTIGHIIVYDETGSILFLKDSVTYNIAEWLNEEFISYTPSGCKMIISQRYTYAAFVYSLPGFLPCHDCTNGVTTSIANDDTDFYGGKVSNYPNPTNGQTIIEYNLPSGSTNAELIFYNIKGQEVKRFKVTSAFHNIVISTNDLEAGTYYYQLQTTNGFRAGKKMIVIN